MPDTMDPQKPGPDDWSKAIDQTHKFELKRYQGWIFEMEVDHFHHDSAVLLPDYDAAQRDVVYDTLTSLIILAKVLKWQEEHPSWKILITGHTDTSGASEYNERLAKMRSDCVLAILNGDNGQILAARDAISTRPNFRVTCFAIFIDDNAAAIEVNSSFF